MYGDLPIINWNRNLFDSILDDFNRAVASPNFSFEDSFPPINLYMNCDSKACVFELALTGYKKEWLNVEIDGNCLKISAEVPEDDTENERKYVKRRIKATSFKKVYKLPEGYDIDSTDVSYEDGLLTIYIPVELKSTAKKFDIK